MTCPWLLRLWTQACSPPGSQACTHRSPSGRALGFPGLSRCLGPHPQSVSERSEQGGRRGCFSCRSLFGVGFAALCQQSPHCSGDLLQVCSKVVQKAVQSAAARPEGQWGCQPSPIT